MDQIKIIDVNSIQDFQKKIEEAEAYLLDFNQDNMMLYRGQSVNKPLYPKIARKEFLTDNRYELEKRVFNQFKRLCIPHLTVSNLTNWDFLVLAQHHSLPTRLLDWTENPLLALWFAFNEDTDEKTIRTVWCYSVKYDEIVNSETGDPFEQTKTLVYQPKHISRRIVSQNSWFTSHYYNKKTDKFTGLNFRLASKSKLYQITFKDANEKLRKEILKTLDTFGINSYSAFPDLEGLCKYLAWKNYKK